MQLMKLEHFLMKKHLEVRLLKDAGELSDDPVVKSIQKQLNNLTSNQLTGFGANGIYLSNLGVRTEKDGLLKFKHNYT